MPQESTLLRPKSNYLQLPSNLRRSIAYPQGPYTTGCADLLIGSDLDGSLIRLYYPTDQEDIRSLPTESWTRWFLGKQYFRGIFVILFNVSFFTFGLLTLFRYIAQKISCFLLRDVLIPAIWEAPICSKKDPIPVVIFSHGLAANRSMYSGICNDIASNGFVVAAVEHRDESASASFILNSVGNKQWVNFKEIKNEDSELKIRIKQVKIRSRECSRALDVMLKLNRGNLEKNLLPSSFKLETLIGRLDLTKPCIAGQSFGGGTVIEVLGQDKRFTFGVSLDPWMFCLGTQAEALSQNIQQPILFILMEKFQDNKNMTYLKLFQNERNTFYTIKDAVHQHQVDSAMILSNDSMIVKKTIDCYSSRFPAEVPLTINNAMTLKFIWNCLGQEMEKQNEIKSFLKKEERHIIDGIHGSAKSMLGWASYDLPLSSYLNN